MSDDLAIRLHDDRRPREIGAHSRDAIRHGIEDQILLLADTGKQAKRHSGNVRPDGYEPLADRICLR